MSEDNKEIKAKVIALPTKGSSVLHIGTKEVSDEPEYGYAPSWGFDVFDINKNFQHRPHHLYLTLEYDKSNSVTHIKEGYLYDNKRNIINQCTGDKDEIKLLTSMNTRYSQIIATTDQDLASKSNLPLISEQFIIEFVKSKGSIKEVFVELEEVKESNTDKGREYSYTNGYKVKTWDGNINIQARNTCIIHPIVERLYTKDEVIEHGASFAKYTGMRNAYDNWLKLQNL